MIKNIGHVIEYLSIKEEPSLFFNAEKGVINVSINGEPEELAIILARAIKFGGPLEINLKEFVEALTQLKDVGYNEDLYMEGIIKKITNAGLL